MCEDESPVNANGNQYHNEEHENSNNEIMNDESVTPVARLKINSWHSDLSCQNMIYKVIMESQSKSVNPDQSFAQLSVRVFKQFSEFEKAFIKNYG